MARGNRIDLLRQVATIRDLQHAVAEEKAARSASELHAKTSAQTEKECLREATQENWLGALSGPSLQVEVSRLWSLELLRQEQAVNQATSRVKAATSELERNTAGWHVATIQKDTAHTMVREAAKDNARRREEAALQNASDRHAQRGSKT
jgi:hypothetical protein